MELVDKLVGVNRVTKVTKGGRAFSFSAIVVVGDENGVVGHGLGKSKDVAGAIQKGIDDAKKNLIRVPLIHGTLLLQPRSHGARCRGTHRFQWAPRGMS